MKQKYPYYFLVWIQFNSQTSLNRPKISPTPPTLYTSLTYDKVDVSHYVG
jgi:hypothetical protein